MSVYECDRVFETSNPVIDLDMDQYPNVIIDPSRAGKSVVRCDDVKVGETVRFVYTAGSEVGERNVLVVKVGYRSFEGPTLERDGGYRKYLDQDIADDRSLEDHGPILIVEPFVKVDPVSTGNVKRVRFDEAIEALAASLTGEQLAALYLQYVALRGDDAEFDPATGEVVVTLPEPKVNKFTKTGHSAFGPDLEITNTNGKKFGIYLYGVETGEIGIHNEVTGTDNSNATPEVLRDELVKFLA